MNSLSLPARRILALALPYLATERLAGSARPDAPLALVAASRGRQIIMAANPAALAEAIAPGLPLADARARLPGLQVAPHDPAGDAACRDWLALAATRYTPMVRSHPRGLLLDITGAAHLFGGEASLVADAVTRLDRLGFTAQPALAATPAAAMALAWFGGSRIEALPAQALTDDEAVLVALRRAGLKSIGAIAVQPRASLAARFGEALLAALDALLEQAAQPLDPLVPVAPVMASRRFAQPIASEDAVLASLETLLLRVGVDLAARGEGGRAFAVQLYRADGHVARLAVETAAPTRDAPQVLRLLRERIAALADPLDPGFGYDLVTLSVPITAPLAEAQLDLAGGQLAEAEVAALVDRLVARLGRGRVRRLAATPSHIPEQAAFDLPIHAPALAEWPGACPSEPPQRPVRLFDPPQPIEVLAEVPDGPPRQFRWRRRLHRITRHEGPERIGALWWRRRDNAGLTRDYYRVEDEEGRRFWLFRHGLYGSETVQPAWFVHGLFA
jgi:protein ImuB